MRCTRGPAERRRPAERRGLDPAVGRSVELAAAPVPASVPLPRGSSAGPEVRPWRWIQQRAHDVDDGRGRGGELVGHVRPVAAKRRDELADRAPGALGRAGCDVRGARVTEPRADPFMHRLGEQPSGVGRSRPLGASRSRRHVRRHTAGSGRNRMRSSRLTNSPPTTSHRRSPLGSVSTRRCGTDGDDQIVTCSRRVNRRLGH